MRTWTPNPFPETEIDDRYVYVAWWNGSPSSIGRRHIADTHGAKLTLCGLTWKRSQEVVPDDYWTSGTCQRCGAALERTKP